MWRQTVESLLFLFLVLATWISCSSKSSIQYPVNLECTFCFIVRSTCSRTHLCIDALIKSMISSKSSIQYPVNLEWTFAESQSTFHFLKFGPQIFACGSFIKTAPNLLKELYILFSNHKGIRTLQSTMQRPCPQLQNRLFS